MAESSEMFHRTPGPLVLDANAVENWRKLLMQFEIYLVAKGKDGNEDKLEVNLLLNCAGPNAIEEHSHFVYNNVVMNLTKMCAESSRNFVEGLRMSFMSDCYSIGEIKKRERKSKFVSELKRLSLNCDFGALRDSLIRDRIVGGVLSDELRGGVIEKTRSYPANRA